MKYLLIIVLLVAVLTAGCVIENKNPVTTSIPMETETYSAITPTSTTITPIVQTVSTVSVISTLRNLKPGQIQCGGYQCPPNWFCCNNICHDPNEGNTGYCCGNTVCPKNWECLQTRYENSCLESSIDLYSCAARYPRYFHSVYQNLTNPEAIPCRAYRKIDDSSVPSTVFDKANYCREKYPNSVYIWEKNSCLESIGFIVPLNGDKSKYCKEIFKSCHYWSDTDTCYC